MSIPNDRLDLYFPNNQKVIPLELALLNLFKNQQFSDNSTLLDLTDISSNNLSINNIETQKIYIYGKNIKVPNNVTIDCNTSLAVIGLEINNNYNNRLIKINNKTTLDYSNFINKILNNYSAVDFVHFTERNNNDVSITIESDSVRFVIFDNCEINGKIEIKTTREIILIFVNSKVNINYRKISYAQLQKITCNDPVVIDCKNELCKNQNCAVCKNENITDSSGCKNSNNMSYIIAIIILSIFLIMTIILYFMKK